MAITLDTVPSVAFTGAPYIISGSSSCTSVPNSHHHRIVLVVTVTFSQLDKVVREFIYNLSTGAKSLFSFNLSETLHYLIRKRHAYNYNEQTGEPSEVSYNKPTISLVLKEVYSVNGKVVHPNTDVTYPISGAVAKPYVIEGTLSDIERKLHPDWSDLKVYTTENKLPLTKRPKKGGIFFLGSRSRLAYFTGGYAFWSTPLRRVGTWIDYNTGVTTTIIVEPKDIMKKLLFVNSFGMIEDAVAFSEDRKSIGTKSNIISGMRPNSFSAQRNLYKRATPGDTEIELSSGPVNEEWAEWWVTEVLRSERAWLYDEKRNYWMEGVIVPAEKNTIIDRTKSQASVIPFTFRCTMQS